MSKVRSTQSYSSDIKDLLKSSDALLIGHCSHFIDGSRTALASTRRSRARFWSAETDSRFNSLPIISCKGEDLRIIFINSQ